MEELKKSCIPCQKGIPPLSREQALKKLESLPNWQLSDDGTKIFRKFKHKNFAEALAFAIKVGECAENEGHHPEITIGWGFCTVVFFTKKINGLHENDFIMAAKVDKLEESQVK